MARKSRVSFMPTGESGILGILQGANQAPSWGNLGSEDCPQRDGGSGADFFGVGSAGAVGEVVGIGDAGHFVADAFATGIFVPAALGAGGDLLGVGVGGLGGCLWRAVSRNGRWAGASAGRWGGTDGDKGGSEEGECFHGDVCLDVSFCVCGSRISVFTEAHRQGLEFDCGEVNFFTRPAPRLPQPFSIAFSAELIPRENGCRELP